MRPQAAWGMKHKRLSLVNATENCDAAEMCAKSTLFPFQPTRLTHAQCSVSETGIFECTQAWQSLHCKIS